MPPTKRPPVVTETAPLITPENAEAIKNHTKIMHYPDGKISKKELPKNLREKTKYSFFKLGDKLFSIYLGKIHSKLVGEGGFGKLKYIENFDAEKSERARLVKIIKTPSEEEIDSAEQEAKVLKALGKSNGYFIYEKKGLEKVFIELEYVPGVNLVDYFNTRKKCTFTQAIKIAYFATKEIKDLHAKGYFHRDIKPENFLYDEETDRLELIDFGMAVKKPLFGQYLSKKIVGTEDFLAPEIKKTGIYSEKTEVYALGIMFREIFEYLRKEKYLKEFEEIAFKQIFDFVKKMIAITPNERPSLQEVFSFFEQVHLSADKIIQLESNQLSVQMRQLIIGNIEAEQTRLREKYKGKDPIAHQRINDLGLFLEELDDITCISIACNKLKDLSRQMMHTNKFFLCFPQLKDSEGCKNVFAIVSKIEELKKEEVMTSKRKLVEELEVENLPLINP